MPPSPSSFATDSQDNTIRVDHIPQHSAKTPPSAFLRNSHIPLLPKPPPLHLTTITSPADHVHKPARYPKQPRRISMPPPPVPLFTTPNTSTPRTLLPATRDNITQLLPTTTGQSEQPTPPNHNHSPPKPPQNNHSPPSSKTRTGLRPDEEAYLENLEQAFAVHKIDILPTREQPRTSPWIKLKNIMPQQPSTVPASYKRMKRKADTVVTMNELARMIKDDSLTQTPRSYKEAVKHPHWVSSMKREIMGLDDRGCFGNLQDLPAGKRTLKVGFVHKIKTDQDGRVLVRDGVPIGCKSRLVVKV